jgi:hypothetical protein
MKKSFSIVLHAILMSSDSLVWVFEGMTEASLVWYWSYMLCRMDYGLRNIVEWDLWKQWQRAVMHATSEINLVSRLLKVCQALWLPRAQYCALSLTPYMLSSKAFKTWALLRSELLMMLFIVVESG